MLKLRPRNGQPEQVPAWEQDDAEDKLAERLSDNPAPLPVDDIPTLPPMVKPPERADLQQRVKPSVPQPPQPNIDDKIREIALKLCDLMTSDDVRCWVQDGNFVATKVFTRDGKQFQQTTTIRFAGVSVKTVELIS